MVEENTLTLSRFAALPDATLGMLFWRGKPISFTLEDPREGRGAIQEGIYPLRWRPVGVWAKRFRERYDVPGSLEVCDVPGRTAILFHPGNTARDTRGCVLPGVRVDDILSGTPTRVLQSVDALKRVLGRVGICIDNEGAWLRVSDGGIILPRGA